MTHNVRNVWVTQCENHAGDAQCEERVGDAVWEPCVLRNVGTMQVTQCGNHVGDAVWEPCG